MIRKTDLRVKLTKRLLKNAIIDLLEFKDVQEISVTELCENAGINRTTFYCHYKSIEEIIIEIENDVLIDYERVYNILTPDYDLDDLISNLLKFFVEHARVLGLVLNKKKDFGLMQQIYRYSFDRFKKYVTDNLSQEKTEPIMYLFYGLSYGIIGIIGKWYKNEMQDPINVVESAITRVMFGILSTIIDFKDII